MLPRMDMFLYMSRYVLCLQKMTCPSKLLSLQHPSSGQELLQLPQALPEQSKFYLTLAHGRWAEKYYRIV